MSLTLSPASQTNPQALYANQNANTHSTNSINPQLVQDFEQLSSSLQSGDLSGAQKSYADLQNLLQSNGAIGAATNGSNTATSAPAAASSSSTASTDPGSQIVSDFNSIGSALASGNLSQAQQDFAQFQKDVVSAYQQNGGASAAHGGHHHHHHHAVDADSGASTTSTATSPSATPPTTSTTSTNSNGTATSPVSVVA